LYDYLLRDVEESYAYPATGNLTEKEHALNNFETFDDRVAMYERAMPDESYEELTLAKQNLMDTAQKMYASYEKDGTVNP